MFITTTVILISSAFCKIAWCEFMKIFCKNTIQQFVILLPVLVLFDILTYCVESMNDAVFPLTDKLVVISVVTVH